MIKCACKDAFCGNVIVVVPDPEIKGNTLIKIVGKKDVFGTSISLTQDQVRELVEELKQ